MMNPSLLVIFKLLSKNDAIKFKVCFSQNGFFDFFFLSLFSISDFQ